MPDWLITVFVFGLLALGVLVILSVVTLPLHLWMYWSYTRDKCDARGEDGRGP